MQEDSIKAFKKELGCYNIYKNKIKKLEELIEETYRLLSGVKAIDTTKPPTHSTPNKELEYKRRNDIEKYRAEIKHCEDNIAYIDSKLKLINGEEIKQQIEMVCINGEPMEKVSKQFYIANGTLQYRIDKELQRILRH